MEEKEWNQSLDILRLVLMVFVCLDTFGCPGGVVGQIISLISGFAKVAFFIISGYLVLADDEEIEARIVRSIRRSAISFGVLFAVYFGISALYYAVGGMNIFVLTPFTSPRFWFQFLALNIWPYDIGGLITYVQMLLYAYVVIFILQKCRLLRFEWLIALILWIVLLVTGEFSVALDIRLFSYAYIPGNFLTLALPYILFGGFLSRCTVFDEVPFYVFFWLILGGAALCPIEVYLLRRLDLFGYSGHLVGMLPLAFGVCMLSILYPNADSDFGEWLADHARLYMQVIYWTLHPCGVVLAAALVALSPGLFIMFQNAIGIAAFLVCLGIAAICGAVRDRRIRKQEMAEEIAMFAEEQERI